MQHKLNPEQGKDGDMSPASASTGSMSVSLCELCPLFVCSISSRFGVSQTSEGSSRSSMENGGREQDRSSESDEDEDSEQNTSETGRSRFRGRWPLMKHGLVSYQPENNAPGSTLCLTLCLFFVLSPGPGPGWTANFRDSGGTSASQTQAGWDSSAGGGAETQESGWANFTEFQPFSG